MAITNATRLSDFAAGIGTEGAILKIDNANQRVGIGTQLPDQMLQVAGIVSATQYIGDGSLLEGIKSAGLGTAISDVDGSAGAVVYYTDDLLTVTENTTINPPASASAAYTQYRDIKLEDSVDLIIETGDDFIPDVLGLSTDSSDPNASGNGVFDEIYSDIIKNKNGLGAPTFANGLTSVGVITATGGFSGNVSGSGANLTNLPAGQLTGALPAISGANLTDLPASGGIAEGVAHGSIGVGTAVAVRSDGKFVAVTGTNEETSTAVLVTDQNGTVSNVTRPTLCYDTANDKVVAVWQGYSDDDCYAMVGTISGLSITWGVPVKYDGNTNARPNAVAYDSTNERIIIVSNQDSGGVISSVVGQVSGTGTSGTITFGSKVSVQTGSNNYPSIAFDSTTGRVIATWRSSNVGKAKIGTISGNSVTWGSETSWTTNTIEKTKVACQGGYAVAIGSGSGSAATYNVGQIASSGNSITWGTQATIATITSDTAHVAADPNTGIWAIQAQDPGDSMVKLHPATRSGSTLTFGTIKQIYTGTGPTNNQSLCWAGGENLFFSTFSAGSSASAGQQFVTSTISGDGAAVTKVSNPQVFLVSNSGNDQPDASASTHTTGGKCVIFIQNNADSRNGWNAVEQVRISTGTSGSYVGLSNAAYTNGQTATVSIVGSVDTNQSGLTPATKYYLMADGNLSSAADSENILVGNALSATKLLLR